MEKKKYKCVVKSAYHAVSTLPTNLIHEGTTEFPLLKSLSFFDHCLTCTHYTIQLFSVLFFSLL